MTEKQLKELIREEYHNVKNFMEEKYGFTPELGKVVSNPYVNAFSAVNESNEEVTPQQLSKIQSDIRKINSKIKVYISKHPITKGELSIELGAGHDDDSEIQKIYKVLKKHTGDWRTGTMFNESVNEGGESDSDMAVDQLETSIRKAQALITKLQGKGDLEPWVQSLITKAEDYISTVSDYGEVEEYDVENEQDIKEFVKFMREYSQKLNLHKGETPKDLYEAEYQGRKVELGKIMQGDVKKFKVYVNNDKGNVVKVNFGQKGMTIKKDNPDARKSFRARMNCDSPGPRWKARYWSCRKW